MSNLQKDRVENIEKEQKTERKRLENTLKSDQRKDRKKFLDNLKEEKREAAKVVKNLPRHERKQALKSRMEEIEQHQHYKEKAFRAKQAEQVNDRLRQYDDRSRRALARAEREFLLEKQTLMKARETALWDMEERQLHDKHQTVKQQLREQYLLQRQQLLARHEKELQQVERQNIHGMEELDMRHKNDNFRLPKQQRQEQKTRLIMFKQALKVQNIIGDAERIRLRDFNIQEDKRIKTEREKMQERHLQQLRELDENNKSNLRELRQLQNEKRRLLIDREDERLNAMETSFRQDLHKWKQQMLPRKHLIDQEFAQQLEQLERFVAAGKKPGHGEEHPVISGPTGQIRLMHPSHQGGMDPRLYSAFRIGYKKCQI